MSNKENTIVLGMQWGDEGKGKVIDLLAGKVDFVVRCQGGANAGHTVVVEGIKKVLHLLPSGALHDSAECIIGNGVVIDPIGLCEELDILSDTTIEKRLLISDRAHLVMPWHKALDAAKELSKGDNKVGTTLRGIGPCYGTKMDRTGIRCSDLLDMAKFTAKAKTMLKDVNEYLGHLGAEKLEKSVLDTVLPVCERISKFVTDTASILHKADAEDKQMLFEGAQGIMLDIDYGTYPFVTSSNTGIGGIITGSGLSHKSLSEVVGIVKAYTTRVGEGPFPTEEDNEIGQNLRDVGGEYGATTGRPRRCGHLDLVVIKFAARLNGLDSIALTKLDVLSKIKEIPVCVGYKVNGKETDAMPADIDDYENLEPIYKTLPGWDEDITKFTEFDQLPQNAKDYVAFIEEVTGVPVKYIGTGPDRVQTIIR